MNLSDLLASLDRGVAHAASALARAAVDTVDSRRFLLAITFQETGLLVGSRRQRPTGPARGWWQFEPIAVREVLCGPRTREAAGRVLGYLGYLKLPAAASPGDIDAAVLYAHAAIEHNDVLAAAFARLFLWPVPAPIPRDEGAGWAQYLGRWAPSKADPDRWPWAWRRACGVFPLPTS